MPDAERASAATLVRVLAALMILTLLSLAGCQEQAAPKILEEIRARGELRVVTINSPTSYYLGANGTEGLEFSLAREFAQQLGVTLVVSPVANVESLKTELSSGKADIAAAQLTADESWNRIGEAAQPYEEIEQLVVYRRGATKPRGPLQIENAKLAVRAGSPQEHILQKLKNTTAPNLDWVITAPNSADPLEDVDSGEANYAIVDAREFSFARHLYPNVL